MKSNVDLTQNRDFYKKDFKTKKSFRQMIGDFIFQKGVSEIRDEYLEDKGLVYQGNKHEREIKALATSFNDGISCDRCGSPVEPYYNDTLCQSCRKKLWYGFTYDNLFWL